MIKCYVVDDELPAIDVLKRYIGQSSILELVGFNNNPLNAIIEIRSIQVDLVFLDIQMDEMTGLELIHTLGADYKYILSTAYSEYALDGFDLDVVDYLLKPIAYDRFTKSINKVQKLIEVNLNNSKISQEYIYVTTEQKGKKKKIDLKDIQFIEARGNYVAFHTLDKLVLSHVTLKDIEEKLEKANFIRVHKSYIVPIGNIEIVQNNEIILKNGNMNIPVSLSYKDNLNNAISPFHI
jgi:two-component system LytT family response regulator